MPEPQHRLQQKRPRHQNLVVRAEPLGRCALQLPLRRPRQAPWREAAVQVPVAAVAPAGRVSLPVKSSVGGRSAKAEAAVCSRPPAEFPPWAAAPSSTAGGRLHRWQHAVRLRRQPRSRCTVAPRPSYAAEAASAAVAAATAVAAAAPRHRSATVDLGIRRSSAWCACASRASNGRTCTRGRTGNGLSGKSSMPCSRRYCDQQTQPTATRPAQAPQRLHATAFPPRHRPCTNLHHRTRAVAARRGLQRLEVAQPQAQTRSRRWEHSSPLALTFLSHRASCLFGPKAVRQ
mmetsp:Transcript_73330/g.203458  ORF Transcript_73330/g.203458 Transcript_73330/m.203458 type:complete len:289 (+) Transcript_73330:703-1569(+)